jgi:hypothetical protein
MERDAEVAKSALPPWSSWILKRDQENGMVAMPIKLVTDALRDRLDIALTRSGISVVCS